MQLQVCDAFSDWMHGNLRSDLERLDAYYVIFSKEPAAVQLNNNQLDELGSLLFKLLSFASFNKSISLFNKRVCGVMEGYGRHLCQLRTVLGDDIRPFLVEHYVLATAVIFHVLADDVEKEKLVKQYESQCVRFFVAIHAKFRDYVTLQKHGRAVALETMCGVVFVFSRFMKEYPYKDISPLVQSFFDMCERQAAIGVMDLSTEQIDADALCDLVDLICNVLGSRRKGKSVTCRIKEVKQPRGGFVNPRTMDVVSLGDGIATLNPFESTSANIVGMVVDYLTRFMLGTSVRDAFSVSLLGAARANAMGVANKLMQHINGLDDMSIISAAHLVTFDAVYRANIPWIDIDDIDLNTIENIRTMVNRSLDFFANYGPKVSDGFTFEGGYTDTVSSGDGDFTTADTLWDFKVSKNPPTKNHTLQLLMYWRMGLHSVHPEFKSIRYLGIYNPRMNTVWRIAVASIPQSVIDAVESEVIGYGEC